MRLAVVPASGSGMEQEVIDRLSDQLQSNQDLKISTVNQDWIASVSIVDSACREVVEKLAQRAASSISDAVIPPPIELDTP